MTKKHQNLTTIEKNTNKQKRRKDEVQEILQQAEDAVLGDHLVDADWNVGTLVVDQEGTAVATLEVGILNVLVNVHHLHKEKNLQEVQTTELEKDPERNPEVIPEASHETDLQSANPASLFEANHLFLQKEQEKVQETFQQKLQKESNPTPSQEKVP